jgi:hypothetical protein
MAMIDGDVQPGAESAIELRHHQSRGARGASGRQARGRPVSFVGSRRCSLPTDKLRAALECCKRVIVAEENHSGLYRSVLCGALPGLELIGVNAVGGMIRPEAILRALE